MRYIYLFLLYCVIFGISCNDRQPIRVKITKNNEVKTCIIADKPKLFLDFWGGMSENEFDCILQTLTKQHKLVYSSSNDRYYYLIDNDFGFVTHNDSLELWPDFLHKKLLKISLIFPVQQLNIIRDATNVDYNYPDKVVSFNSVESIEKYLHKKYGNGIKLTSTSNNGLVYSTLVKDTEFFKWKVGQKIIELNKTIVPIYKDYQIRNSDGDIIIGHKILDRMTVDASLIYTDKIMNDLLNKEHSNDKVRKEKQANSKLEKL